MPPTFVHLNGSINLPDSETVFRELSARVGSLALSSRKTVSLSGRLMLPLR